MQTKTNESMTGVNVRLSNQLIDNLANEANIQRRTMRSLIRYVVQCKLINDGYIHRDALVRAKPDA